MWVYIGTSDLKNAYIGYVKEYTLDGSTVPNTDTNVYVDITQSWYTISRVILEWSVTYSWGATYSSDFWCRLSYTNNTQTRWWLWLPFWSIHQNGSNVNKWNPWWYGKVDGRYQNGATTIFKAMSSNAWVQVGTDTFRLDIWENGAICTVNSDTETWTYTTAEKQIISSIFGSSTAKFYASRSNTSGYWPVINGNIIATVSYS